MAFDSRIQQLVREGDAMFSKRARLHSLWQHIAEQFCPQYGQFTRIVDPGEEYASKLTTSYPLLVQREFSSAISAMTRPRDIVWGRMGVEFEDDLDKDELQWLEWATMVLRRAMYDRGSQFTRATKEADEGFGAFGQWPMTVEWDRVRGGMLYRSWHLKDVVWTEDYKGEIGRVDRNWCPDARTLVATFRGTVGDKVKRIALKEPGREIKCRRIMVRAEDVDPPSGQKRHRFDWVSIFVDLEHQTVLEETPARTSMHVIPRWRTLPGSPYAYSPCTTIALPDARLLQAMTLTLLEAGEMAVRPPMIAVGDAIRSDLNLFAGGVTKVDAEYDERLGEVLRPITQDKNGLPFGHEQQMLIKDALASAFYLNKLTLPPSTKEMTAFETSQRIQEYIRGALPLFEPLEDEYNGALCEHTFQHLSAAGVFNRNPIPPRLAGAQVQWKFVSPLHDAIERKLSGAFTETTTLLQSIAQLDPTILNEVDLHVAFRDALKGIGAPFRWRRSEDEAAQITAEQKQAQADAQQLQSLHDAGTVAQQIGAGGQALRDMVAGQAA